MDICEWLQIWQMKMRMRNSSKIKQTHRENFRIEWRRKCQRKNMAWQRQKEQVRLWSSWDDGRESLFFIIMESKSFFMVFLDAHAKIEYNKTVNDATNPCRTVLSLHIYLSLKRAPNLHCGLETDPTLAPCPYRRLPSCFYGLMLRIFIALLWLSLYLVSPTYPHYFFMGSKRRIFIGHSSQSSISPKKNLLGSQICFDERNSISFVLKKSFGASRYDCHQCTNCVAGIVYSGQTDIITVSWSSFFHASLP